MLSSTHPGEASGVLLLAFGSLAIFQCTVRAFCLYQSDTMPKNKLGGNKAKRAKASTENNKKELEFKEDGQELGSRCKMRKKVWCNQGDIVLVSLRDFQDEKGDIITKYTAEEARSLKNYGELPENVKINETDIGDGDDSEDGVEFDETAGVDVDNI
eukprot:s3028_g3.t1